jgi:CheY-like chemotaxis protein
VKSFASPIEAARYLEGHPVDLAFLDLMMPGMSGLELAAKVKASNPQARVVICTGYLAENIEKMQHARHVDQVLLKPFQIDDVLKIAEACRTA